MMAKYSTLTLLSLNHLVPTLEVCLGSLSILKTHLRPSLNFLTDVLRCCFSISTPFCFPMIYFVKYTSPSCRKAPPQHDAATPVFHGWGGVLWLASLPLFPPNITMVIMAKQFYFCFICTFRTKVRSSLGDRTRLLPERYNGCVVPWCLHLRTIVCTDERVTFIRL